MKPVFLTFLKMIICQTLHSYIPQQELFTSKFIYNISIKFSLLFLFCSVHRVIVASGSVYLTQLFRKFKTPAELPKVTVPVAYN